MPLPGLAMGTCHNFVQRDLRRNLLWGFWNRFPLLKKWYPLWTIFCYCATCEHVLLRTAAAILGPWASLKTEVNMLRMAKWKDERNHGPWCGWWLNDAFCNHPLQSSFEKNPLTAIWSWVSLFILQSKTSQLINWFSIMKVCCGGSEPIRWKGIKSAGQNVSRRLLQESVTRRRSL